MRDARAAVELLGRLRSATGDAVTSFEYLPRVAVDSRPAHTRRHRSARTPLRLPRALRARVDPRGSGVAHDPEAALEDAMGAGLVLDAVLASSLSQRNALWRMRESVPEAQRDEGASIKHDVSVPVAACRISWPKPRLPCLRSSPTGGWLPTATSATATCTST